MSRLSWAITGLLLLVTGSLAWALAIPVEVGHLSLNVVVTLVFAPVAFVYGRLRYDAALAGIADAVALLAGFTLVAAVATYVATVAGAPVPLRDAWLFACDHGLGLDWRGYLAWLDAHPRLGALLDGCYQSPLKQMAAALLLLPVLGFTGRLQVFVLALQLSLLVCAACPAVLPALGAYHELHVVAAVDHPHIPLTLMNGAVPQILQLRGPQPLIRLDEIEGIVVFPSFHTVLAILLAWAFWAVPWVRWPALLLNAGMLAATPLSGGHYFVDIGAGALLAAASLAVAGRLAGQAGEAPEAAIPRTSPVPAAV